MRDITGLTLEARVFAWSMHSITFEIPSGLTGIAHLGVKNDVGLARALLVHLHATSAGSPQVHPNLFAQRNPTENARGVYFNNEFWVFYPEKDTVSDKNNDILVRKFDYTTGTFTKPPYRFSWRPDGHATGTHRHRSRALAIPHR